MGTKTISISDEAYTILKGLKSEGESFSRAIVRMSGKRPLSSFYGILSESEGKELANNIKDFRIMRRESRKKRMERYSDI
tara:strand:+ start:212 stop:451 length:240 start_codon:yes stop_codon:yes gene_type:complete